MEKKLPWIPRIIFWGILGFVTCFLAFAAGDGLTAPGNQATPAPNNSRNDRKQKQNRKCVPANNRTTKKRQNRAMTDTNAGNMAQVIHRHANVDTRKTPRQIHTQHSQLHKSKKVQKCNQTTANHAPRNPIAAQHCKCTRNAHATRAESRLCARHAHTHARIPCIMLSRSHRNERK